MAMFCMKSSFFFLLVEVFYTSCPSSLPIARRHREAYNTSVYLKYEDLFLQMIQRNGYQSY